MHTLLWYSRMSMIFTDCAVSAHQCLPQVVHTALAVVNILQQQYRQLPSHTLPLNLTKQPNQTTITYRATHVHKVVDWATFSNADKAGLMLVSTSMLQPVVHAITCFA